ncbi:hypothetical protein W97_03747 [Coniosporium apollinis CBS 100218]|uniref:Short-chain dehydrogenase/reductase n=1 Tax=Coniosporium apollinis (strain CBS 100218) TaxID=1168221 RepID=R7YRR6_CONA1|nr:uncharacterized protein W97_03747 [Coniosporium apollinis CBS 100218]EON64514.1 hypothetical protein W97_03747 [Coniosporium apollinis CBS 100218]
MVTLPAIRASNELIPTALPPNLVAIFAGATSGIGEATLKEFATKAVRPRVYFIGRNQEAADRITTECKALNPDGEFNFIKADLSSMKNVDQLCEEIIKIEAVLNLLFMSQGVPSLDKSLTPEGLHLLLAPAYYGRILMASNLLPLLTRASQATSPSLSRVISVAAGTSEGHFYPADIPALTLGFRAIKGHLCTLMTLALSALAKQAPGVSFVHTNPGVVRTQYITHRVPGLLGAVLSAVTWIAGSWLCVPVAESGERHLWVCTTARFAPGGVEGVEGAEVAKGTDGKVGSGVYSIDQYGEVAGEKVVKLLEEYRRQGMEDIAWNHTMGEVERIRTM